jgi:hypothetical protein
MDGLPASGWLADLVCLWQIQLVEIKKMGE